MGGWYLLVYSYSFNQLKIKILLTYFVHLMQWFATKKEEVSSKSRTVALWLNYVHYIEIVQQFITAERTSNSRFISQQLSR